MHVTKEAPHMFFDVDGTLVSPLEGAPYPGSGAAIRLSGQYFKVNQDVISVLKLCKVRGHVVVVWSQGGAAWADRVVSALALSDYVDVVIAKPSWYVDDLSPEEILDKSRWYDGKF